MFSDKENVNILTAILVEYGVEDAVVCPGSRNAPIVHNLSQCGRIRCHPVTDERSAGFYAMGLALATCRPTVVCVTSGTALLNLAPAVAEAFYRHVPLVVVSADRPQQWIGQLDGQTLPQPDALGRFVRKAVSLPELAGCHSGERRYTEERWLCRRLVCEAMLSAVHRQPEPVHINVPISEPLFSFGVEELPRVRTIRTVPNGLTGGQCRHYVARSYSDFVTGFLSHSKPIIVIGQMPAGLFGKDSHCGLSGIISSETMRLLSESFVVFAEPLSNSSYSTIHFDEAVRLLRDGKAVERGDAGGYEPDCVLYIGDTIVSKPTRQWLRGQDVDTYLLTPDALDVHDTFMSLGSIVECPLRYMDCLLRVIGEAQRHPEDYGCSQAEDYHDGCVKAEKARRTFHDRWNALLARCASRAEDYQPAYSQMAVVKYFEEQLADLDTGIHTHYANSTAIRLACIYAQHYVWCNRGVNGIEGSLSTAAGFSLGTDDMTVCVTGDLSFFYDQNALWNRNIDGRLRIILLNNHCGGIFRQLPGLDKSPAADSLVGAEHDVTAQGICTQNDIGYLSAKSMDEMQIGIVTLLTRETDRPMLLEVFTDAEDDARVLKEYFSWSGHKKVF